MIRIVIELTPQGNRLVPTWRIEGQTSIQTVLDTLEWTKQQVMNIAIGTPTKTNTEEEET